MARDSGPEVELVRDIRPGPEGFADELRASAVGSRWVFTANDGEHGFEPWVTDGTAQGTSILGDFAPGSSGSNPGWAGLSLGTLYFTMWRPSPELWRTDGTPSGTALVHVPPVPGIPRAFTAVGQVTLFEDCDDVDGRCTLWKTEGTPASTSLVVDLGITTTSSFFGVAVDRGSDLLFAAETGTLPLGRLWRTDSTDSGTYPFAFSDGSPLWIVSDLLAREDGSVLASGFGSVEGELFRIDGDVVSLVRDISPGDRSYPGQLTSLGSLVLFSADDGAHGRELWATDGSSDGTDLVLDILPGWDSSSPYGLVVASGRIWFAARDNLHGSELWESTGTPGSTLVHDLTPGLTATAPSRLVVREADSGSLAYISHSVVVGFEATSGSALALYALSAETPWWEIPIGAVDGEIYFFDLASQTNCELWWSDGTVSGTRRVAVVGTGVKTVCPGEVGVLSGSIYFAACQPALGCELWRSDGTEAGTGPLFDLVPGEGSSAPFGFSAAQSRLYYAACDLESGCEPWISDGTAAGSHRVEDLFPGPNASLWTWYGGASPGWEVRGQFTESNNWLYFPGDEGTGTELWAMRPEIFYDGFETGDLARWGPRPEQ